MSDVNVAIISGRLTRTPELRTTPSGVSVCDLGVAVNRYSSAGKQYTVFPRVTVWDKQADWVGANLVTGDHIFIQGMLVPDNFERVKGDASTLTTGRLKIDNARVTLLRKKGTEAEMSETDTPDVELPPDLVDVPEA